MTKPDEPAFPYVYPGDHVHASNGLTKREYAAITLRVPTSGDAEIERLTAEDDLRKSVAAANRRLVDMIRDLKAEINMMQMALSSIKHECAKEYAEAPHYSVIREAVNDIAEAALKGGEA